MLFLLLTVTGFLMLLLIAAGAVRLVQGAAKLFRDLNEEDR